MSQSNNNANINDIFLLCKFLQIKYVTKTYFFIIFIKKAHLYYFFQKKHNVLLINKLIYRTLCLSININGSFKIFVKEYV